MPSWRVIFGTVFVGFVALTASRFVPYSVHGPAMTCSTVLHQLDSHQAVLEFAQRNDGDVVKTIRYLENSGFVLRNLSLSHSPNLVMVFTHKHEFACWPLNMMSFYAKMVRLVIENDGHSGKVIDAN